MSSRTLPRYIPPIWHARGPNQHTFITELRKFGDDVHRMLEHGMASVEELERYEARIAMELEEYEILIADAEEHEIRVQAAEKHKTWADDLIRTAGMHPCCVRGCACAF